MSLKDAKESVVDACKERCETQTYYKDSPNGTTTFSKEEADRFATELQNIACDAWVVKVSMSTELTINLPT